MTRVFVEALGWAGAGALLLAYVLTSRGRLDARGRAAAVLNIGASVGLAVNAGYHGAVPGTVLNTIWGLIAIAALATALRSRPKPASAE